MGFLSSSCNQHLDNIWISLWKKSYVIKSHRLSSVSWKFLRTSQHIGDQTLTKTPIINAYPLPCQYLNWLVSSFSERNEKSGVLVPLSVWESWMLDFLEIYVLWMFIWANFKDHKEEHFWSQLSFNSFVPSSG